MIRHLHLRVEEAGGRLHDADSLVVDRHRVEVVLAVLQNSHKLQAQILRVELGGEGVRDGLLGTRWDLDRVLLRGEVADDVALSGLFLEQRSADDGDAYGSWLSVVDGQPSLGSVTIDELDTEDLRLREGHRDLDIEVGRLRLILCDLLDLQHTIVSSLMSFLVSVGAHLDGRKGTEGAQRKQQQGGELPRNHGGCGEKQLGWMGCERNGVIERGFWNSLSYFPWRAASSSS